MSETSKKTSGMYVDLKYIREASKSITALTVEELITLLQESVTTFNIDPDWRSVSEHGLPDTSTNKFGDSTYLLCFNVNSSSPPFVACYSTKNDKWTVAHHFATAENATVTHYRELPELPEF